MSRAFSQCARKGCKGFFLNALCALPKTWNSSYQCQCHWVGKAEWLPGEVRNNNLRFVVTSLPKQQWGTRELYEQLYCARGEMENRIKEQQLDLFADRTSAGALRANQLRLHWALFTAALLCYFPDYLSENRGFFPELDCRQNC